MNRIRALVVDDSVVIRRVLSDLLAEVPWIEVVGTAHNGRVALQTLPTLEPDVITLDIEMPELNGLETLTALRKDHPRLPVIMVSTLTGPGAEATLDALARGATDFVTKPSTTGGLAEAQQLLRDQLLPRIASLFPGRVPAVAAAASTRPPAAPSQAAAPKTFGRMPVGPIELIAIGVSTGGPNALAADVIPSLPPDLSVPVLIVQHMPPLFTRLLAERLSTRTRLPVREGLAGEVVRPGTIWIAPGGLHLEVERHGLGVRLRTHSGPPENSCRPAVDVLFRSVAAVYGPRALGVILTGMGQDGLEGCRVLKAAGNPIIVQDEATSVVWGMPGYVAQAGLADAIVPLREIGPAIARRVAASRSRVSSGDRTLMAARGGPR